jgi:hypothetical protein
VHRVSWPARVVVALVLLVWLLGFGYAIFGNP